MSLEPGQKLGRYRIERLIAQGGMAEVYRADQELAAGIFRPAALKVIRVEYSESPDFREMFLDEARVACTLSHPNIVHIYEVGEAEGRLFMAMELVTGETLATISRTLRERDERLSDEALFAVGISTCSALAAVHALKAESGHVNLVHRDVSPHNLLLASDGTLKLIDFGIAKAATNRNLTNPGVTKGKAGYFSPEQAMGKALDGRSDLFSLAVTLYKLASGVTPFDQHKTHHERNSALVRGQWRRLEDQLPGLPRGIYEVVGRAMQLKPADRYSDAREMREALERAAFAAGIPVRQDALFGYVSSDGEVSGSRPSASTRVAQSPLGPEPTATQKPPRADAPRGSGGGQRRLTERVMKAPAPQTTVTGRARRKTRALVAATLVGAVALGSLGTVLLTTLRQPDAAAKPAAEKAPPAGDVDISAEPPRVATTAITATEPPAPAPGLPADPEPAPAAAPAVGATAGAGAASPAPPQRPAPAAPTVRLHRPRPAVAAVPGPPAAPEPAPEPAIPQGEGVLRVHAQAATTTPVTVLVNGKTWGPAPQNKKIASGHYAVELRLENGKRLTATRATVLPDGKTALIYDVDAKSWSEQKR